MKLLIKLLILIYPIPLLIIIFVGLYLGIVSSRKSVSLSMSKVEYCQKLDAVLWEIGIEDHALPGARDTFSRAFGLPTCGRPVRVLLAEEVD